jgi:outer membrane protein assembly factor BamB
MGGALRLAYRVLESYRSSDPQRPPRRKARFWPALAIVALTALAIAVLWSVPEMQYQQRNIRTAVTLMISGSLLLIWFLFFSRLRWTVRLIGLAVAAVAVVAARSSFRIRGVSGDLVPIVELRWKSGPRFAALKAATPPPVRKEFAGEFPQFYGPNRNAVVPGPQLEADWGAYPPRILWKQPVGAGWSGFAVQEGMAVTLEQRGESEYVVCYDVQTGSTLWTHADDGAKYSTTIAGEGPRTTPTIVSNRVYTFGATGILNCFDLPSGKLNWTRNVAKENDAPLPDWGFASSPLVVDDKVVLGIGGSGNRSMVAYSANDGQPVWADGEGGADYSSPVCLTLCGTPQIVLFAGKVISRDLKGKQLWTYAWPGGHPHVTPPLIIATNQLIVSSGYGTGAELLEISQNAEGSWSATRLWKAMVPKSKFGPLFHVGDALYGLDDGVFSCVALKTGQRMWKDGRYGHGQGLLVGEQILLTAEKGELILIEPNPEKLVELARFKVFNDKTWNPPALAGEYLLMRNDKEAACLQLKRKKALEKS